MNKSKCFEVCWPLKPKRSFLTSWILFMSFAKILSGTQLECQTFWMQTRNDFQLVLILVLTVCKVISRRHCLSDEMLYTVTRVFLHISVQWHRSQFYNIKCKLYLKFKYNTIEPERSFFYKLFVVCWLFFKITFFNKFFQKHTIRVSVGLDQDKDQHSSRPWSGSLLFAKVISRWQKSLLTEQNIFYCHKTQTTHR